LRPCNRFLRKTKAAWNILSDVGLKVGILGCWATWPAEEVNGHLLSDRFTHPGLANRWFPQDLIKQADVDSLLNLIDNPAPQDLQFFTQFSYDPTFRKHFRNDSREYMRNDLVHNLITSFYKDRFCSRLGLKLLDENEYALLAVYFYGSDPAGHAFSRFKFPELFLDVEPEESDYFGDIIDKYYVWVDKQIGKYLEKTDQNTTVVVCSDHGMGPWMKMSSVKNGVRLSGSHRKDGVVILWGNHIRKGVNITPRNLLDVFPTILYLIGMPTALDMDGTVMKDAISQEYLDAFPGRSIETYETRRYKYDPHVAISSKPSVDEKMMDRLRSLGYL
jgi:predicted AlkP superfamily phosphohydrolase/phosphomutase